MQFFQLLIINIIDKLLDIISNTLYGQLLYTLSDWKYTWTIFKQE